MWCHPLTFPIFFLFLLCSCQQGDAAGQDAAATATTSTEIAGKSDENTENEKDAEQEKSAAKDVAAAGDAVTATASPATPDADKTIESANETLNESKATSETGDSAKKSKKDKVKKKFSFRAFSFSKKDKQKPDKKKEDKETNGEPEKVVEEVSCELIFHIFFDISISSRLS